MLRDKDSELEAEISAKKVELREMLELKCLEVKKQLEEKDKEMEGRMAVKTEEFNLSAKQNEDQFKEKMVEAQLLLLSKEEELVKLRGQSVELEEAKKVVKRAVSEAESLKKQLLVAKEKVAK